VAADLAGSASTTEVHARGTPIVGFLSDGRPYFAPIGKIIADDSRVTCHLCGRSFRPVAAHLRSHGWTKPQYCEAFGLERGQSLEGPDTRKVRSVSFSARLVFEAAVRDGSARGRERARAGRLTQEAAVAARGRPSPEQRRLRSKTAMSASARMQLARANRERAAERLAAAAATGADDRLDARCLPVLRTIGFEDVRSYLQTRHVVEHMSVNAIAREVGLSFPAVKSALLRHGVTVSPHATKRHAARQRATEVAETLGVGSVTEFIESCQAQGWTWHELGAASGQPVSWLRRQKHVRAQRSLA
jgi:hypothetical protein